MNCNIIKKICFKCRKGELNTRPIAYKAIALPIELSRLFSYIINNL